MRNILPDPDLSRLMAAMKTSMCLPVIFLGILTFSCGQAEDSKVMDLDPAGADKILAERGEDVVVLDVRTPEEVAAGHIKNSININIHDDDFVEQVKKLNPAKTYLVHCASGSPTGRSRKSVDVLLSLGAEKVYHLNGGFKAWEKAGKAVEREGEK